MPDNKLSAQIKDILSLLGLFTEQLAAVYLQEHFYLFTKSCYASEQFNISSLLLEYMHRYQLDKTNYVCEY